MRVARLYSNDPNKSCKVFCNVCDQIVTLSGLRKHLSFKDKTTLTEYKRLYGNPNDQIIEVIHHQCKLCSKILLLDTDVMNKHMKIVHQETYRSYLAMYMRKGSGIIRKTTPNAVKDEEVEMKKEKIGENLVQIRCDQCLKVFKQNIQLKIHKKRNHSSF